MLEREVGQPGQAERGAADQEAQRADDCRHVPRLEEAAHEHPDAEARQGANGHAEHCDGQRAVARHGGQGEEHGAHEDAHTRAPGRGQQEQEQQLDLTAPGHRAEHDGGGEEADARAQQYEVSNPASKMQVHGSLLQTT